MNTNRSTYSRGGRGRGGRGFDRGGRYFFTRITNKDSISTISMLYSLGENPRRDQFIIFQQELAQHVLKKFEKLGDIVGSVTEMIDLTQIILRGIPRASEREKTY